MGIPQLETCCCGCTLRTGTKIIGWFSLVFGILGLIMLCMGLAGIYYFEDHTEIDSKEAMEIRAHLPVLKALTIFLIVLHIFNCGLAFILLLGAYQKKAKFVLIWVAVTLTAALIELLLNIVQMVILYQPSGVISIIAFLIELYFILVVYSFYREIQNVSSYP